jgi:hypothetical protein
MVLTRDRELRMPGTTKVRAELPKDTRLARETAIKVRAQGEVYEVQLWKGTRPDASGEGGFGESVAVLAVYPENAPAPTDVAEVQTDRESYLNDKLVALGGDDAFAVFNPHLNAGEDYNLTSLFHLRNGRLRRVDEIATYAARAANCALSSRQALHWDVAASPTPMPPIVADVETVRAPAEIAKEDCPQRKVAERRTHERTTYRWNARQARYVKEGTATAKSP